MMWISFPTGGLVPPMITWWFQSAPARSGRLAGGLDAIAVDTVSIHARAKRAAIYKEECPLRLESFNPRPREAGDNGFSNPQIWFWLFQSAPAPSGRHGFLHARRSTGPGFNPRPREAGDPFADEFISVHEVVVSIRARAKQATMAARR